MVGLPVHQAGYFFLEVFCIRIISISLVLALLVGLMVVPAYAASSADDFPILSYTDILDSYSISSDGITTVTLKLPLEDCFWSVVDSRGDLQDVEVASGGGNVATYVPKVNHGYAFSVGFKWLSAVGIPDNATFHFKARIKAEQLDRTACFQPRLGLAYTSYARICDELIWGSKQYATTQTLFDVDEVFESSVTYEDLQNDNRHVEKISPICALVGVHSPYAGQAVTMELVSCYITFDLDVALPDVDINENPSNEDVLDQTQQGLADFLAKIITSGITFELYMQSFTFLNACITPFLSIPYFDQLLTISLSLGTFAFLLNVALAGISKLSSNSKSKGGK